MNQMFMCLFQCIMEIHTECKSTIQRLHCRLVCLWFMGCPSPVKRSSMGLLSDMKNCGLPMRREYRERFPHPSGLAIPTCITARACRTCRDACRNRKLAVSFEIYGGENVPGACATCNFTYLVRGPSYSNLHTSGTTGVWHKIHVLLTIYHNDIIEKY